MTDREFSLAVAACRAAYRKQPASELGPFDEIDWTRLLALVGRHRVVALCWEGLDGRHGELPGEIADRFARDAETSLEQSLRLAAESVRIRRAFDEAGVDLLFLKGSALAALAYSDPFLKQSCDIDILVAPERLDEAASALRSADYASVIPGSSDLLDQWHRRSKESLWRHVTQGFVVDLHTRLTDHHSLLCGIGIDSPRQMARLGDSIELPTLREDENFAYLCVHGASSSWFRLKWLVDLAALLNGKGEREVERLYRSSQQLGAGRSAGQALLLARQYFGTEVSPILTKELERDPGVRALAAAARAYLGGHRSLGEPTATLLGTLPLHWAQMLLAPDLKFKWLELLRRFRGLRTRQWAR
ncbi:MAG TPA: nucleotidyltransferase family protein [Sphingomicrobium sp.]|nr:nucleotidyltransferase family protein [Sphingomicrobium sp.]